MNAKVKETKNVCAGDRGVTKPIMLKNVTFLELLNKITEINEVGLCGWRDGDNTIPNMNFFSPHVSLIQR